LQEALLFYAVDFWEDRWKAERLVQRFLGSYHVQKIWCLFLDFHCTFRLNSLVLCYSDLPPRSRQVVLSAMFNWLG